MLRNPCYITQLCYISRMDGALHDDMVRFLVNQWAGFKQRRTLRIPEGGDLENPEDHRHVFENLIARRLVEAHIRRDWDEAIQNAIEILA